MPFLFYVVHLPLLHVLAVGLAWMMVGNTGWMFGVFVPEKPADYGLGLPGVYAVWLCVVVALYPLCRWLASIKEERREWWWSYL